MTSRSARAAARLACILCCLSFPAGLLLAQNENETVGFQSNHLFEGGHFGENIDILNGGLNLTIPIGPGYQVSRYLTYQLKLSYGSKIWDHTPFPTGGFKDRLIHRSAMGLGFTMHFGRIYKDVERSESGASVCTWYYVSPDGNEHPLPPEQPSGPTFVDPCTNLPSGTTSDTTYYSMSNFALLNSWDGIPTAENPAPVLRMTSADGRLVYEFGHFIQVYTSTGNAPLNIKGHTQVADTGYETDYNRDFGGWYVTKIYDVASQTGGDAATAQNYLTITYPAHPVDSQDPNSNAEAYTHVISNVIDSLGRRIDFERECVSASGSGVGPPCLNGTTVGINNKQRAAYRIKKIKVPAFANSTSVAPPTQAQYDFSYAWTSVDNPDFDCSISGPCAPFWVNTLSSITYPEVTPHSGATTNYLLTFAYSPMGGEIATRTLPTGGEIAYIWDRYWYLSGDTRQLIRKQLRAVHLGTMLGEWIYTREASDTGTPLTNPKHVTVRDANGNDTLYLYRASGNQPVEPPAPVAPDYDDGWAPEWDDGVNFRIEYFQGSGSSRQLIRSENRAYDSDRDATTSKHRGDNVRLNYFVTTYEDDGGKQSTTEYRNWNGKGLWRETIESGQGIEGARTTFTAYGASGDAGVFYYREISDGARVLSRTDNEFDSKGRLVLSADRAVVPSQIGTPALDSAHIASAVGDVYTVYTYDDANLAAGHQPFLKEISSSIAPVKNSTWTWNPGGQPQYRIQYGYQSGGYLVSKKFYNFPPPVCVQGVDPPQCWDTPPPGAPPDGGYFGWKAIDRQRDGNTGLIILSRDTAQTSTHYTYDNLGRVTKVTPSGSELETKIDYASITRTNVRQGAGSTFDCDDSAAVDDFILSCYTYDTLGRLVRTQKRAFDGRSVSQETELSGAGLMLSQTEWHWPGENLCAQGTQCATRYEYGSPIDPFGRVRKATTADGKVTQTSYIGQSTLVTVEDISTIGDDTFDAQTRYTRDVWGRLTDVLPPSGGGASASYTYDLRDKLIKAALTDPTTLAVQTRVFEYDSLNRLHASVNPENGAEIVTGYDGLGNVTASTDGSGSRTLRAYDGAGRLVAVMLQEYQKPGTATPMRRMGQRNRYDGPDSSLWGRLAKTESYDDAGDWIHSREFTYQELNGRLSRERNYFAGGSGSTILDAAIDYTYNAFGLVNRTVYPEGAPTKGGAFATVNNYVNGHLLETWDAASCNARQGSEPPGKGCPSCVNPQSCVPQARAALNAAGGVLEVQTPGNRKTRIEPDSRNRAKSIVVSNLDSTDPLYDSGDYEYDGAGNIHKMGLNRYGYDPANRLVRAFDSFESTIREEVYSYDAFGNMTARTLTVGEAQTTDTFSVGIDNRIVQHVSGVASNFTYDARGNVTSGDGKVYDLDSRNRAVASRTRSGSLDSELGRYAYDADGSRVRKLDRQRDTWTFYVRDAQGRLMSEFRLTSRGTYTPEWLKHHMYLGDRMIGVRENSNPGPPAGLSASVTVNGSNANIQLTWSATPQDEAPSPAQYQYMVYRSANLDPPEWSVLNSGNPISAASYTDSRTTGTWWKYAVTALIGSQAGYLSDSILVKAGGNALLTAPTGLVATAGDRRVALKWTQSQIDTVRGYHVYRAVGTQTPYRITQNLVAQPAMVNGLKIRYVDEGATNGTTYRYSVTAVSANSESTKSAEATATPNDFSPPGPPLAVRAVAACDGTSHVNVSWELNLATQGVTFTLFRKDPQGQIVSFAVNGSTYTDASTASDAQYTYWVKAVDASLNISEESLHVPVRTRDAGAVAIPGRPMVKANDHVVTLRAPSSGGNMRVYRKRNMDLACEAYEIVGTVYAGQIFTDATVTNNSAYDYALATIDATGRESVLSETALAVPLSPPTGFSQCVEKLGTVPDPIPPSWQSPWKDGARQCANREMMRAILRWQASDDPQYQPLWMTNTDDVAGYLLGYRLYKFKIPANAIAGLNENSLVPLQDDYQKTHCYLHPGIPCAGDAFCPPGDRCSLASQFCSGHPEILCTPGGGQCPAGDDCINAPSVPPGTCEDSGASCTNDCAGPVNDPRRCLGRQTGICVPAAETVCNVDAQCSGALIHCRDNVCQPTPTVEARCFEDSGCSSTSKCHLGAGQDPYLTRYVDSGINTFVSEALDTTRFSGCLSIKAVYRIYANGAWRDVESDFASNFDPSSPSSPCLQFMPDLCTDVAGTSGVQPENWLPCAPARTLPPIPGKPVATSPLPGTLEVRWDPPSSCEPNSLTPCTDQSGCSDPEQYCDIDDPLGVNGHCRFRSPAYCCTLASCSPQVACGAGQTCIIRENEIAGYYIYADEKSVDSLGYDDRRRQRHHFNPDSPVAVTDVSSRLYTFSNLAPWLSTTNPTPITFRIASYDHGGRMSSLTDPSEIVAPQQAGGIAAPASLKTVVWAVAGLAQDRKGIRVDWKPGASYSTLTGYRLWRSLSEGGPYCALIYSTPSSPFSLECRDQATLGSTEVSTNKLSFIDDTASPEVPYYYAVSAVTTGGAESVRSSPVPGVLFPSAIQPLSPPVSFVAESPKGRGLGLDTEFAGIYLRWCPNPYREGVTSYRVYRANQSLGPYTQIATIPATCVDSKHRCEIDLDDEPTVKPACFSTPTVIHPMTDTCCVAGIDGTCRIIDTTVDQAHPNTPPNPPVQPIYYYVVTAVRGTAPNEQESAFSIENEGWPNYNPGSTGTWRRVFDPDNSPEAICGESSAELEHQEDIVASRMTGESMSDPEPGEGPAEDFLRAPYRVIGLAPSDLQPNAVARFVYFHLDHLGTPRVVTKADGSLLSKHHYMPFGQEMPGEAQGSTSKRQFTGQERDPEAGLDYMLARYYSSSLGRFMAVDPGDDTVLESPQSWNKYAYVRNNPLAFIDPTGTMSVKARAESNGAAEYANYLNVSVSQLAMAQEYGSYMKGGGIYKSEQSTAGGSEGQNNEVTKHYSLTTTCSATASGVMSAVQGDFAQFGNYSRWAGTESVAFSPPADLKPGSEIPIKVSIFGVTQNMTVTVESMNCQSLTFTTTPGHLMYPASITFASAPASAGSIHFSIDIAGTVAQPVKYEFGGAAFSKAQWHHFLGQVSNYCKGDH